jgi:hypothetical protein
MKLANNKADFMHLCMVEVNPETYVDGVTKYMLNHTENIAYGSIAQQRRISQLQFDFMLPILW